MVKFCRECNKPEGTSGVFCDECGLAYYCSRTCFLLNWASKHSKTCPGPNNVISEEESDAGVSKSASEGEEDGGEGSSKVPAAVALSSLTEAMSKVNLSPEHSILKKTISFHTVHSESSGKENHGQKTEKHVKFTSPVVERCILVSPTQNSGVATKPGHQPKKSGGVKQGTPLKNDAPKKSTAAEKPSLSAVAKAALGSAQIHKNPPVVRNKQTESKLQRRPARRYYPKDLSPAASDYQRYINAKFEQEGKPLIESHRYPGKPWGAGPAMVPLVPAAHRVWNEFPDDPSRGLGMAWHGVGPCIGPQNRLPMGNWNVQRGGQFGSEPQTGFRPFKNKGFMKKGPKSPQHN